MKRLLLIAALALAACDSCIKLKIRPIIYPTHAIVCEGFRNVYCDANLAAGECAYVQNAVAEINAVVPGLLRFKGQLPHDKVLATIEGPSIVVVDAVPRMKPSKEIPLAVTMMRRNPLNHCFSGGAFVLLIAPIDYLSADDWREVVLHEMMHAIGADHAPQNTPLSTIMRPALSERRTGLSENDKAWLRMVYVRGF